MVLQLLFNFKALGLCLAQDEINWGHFFFYIIQKRYTTCVDMTDFCTKLESINATVNSEIFSSIFNFLRDSSKDLSKHDSYILM